MNRRVHTRLIAAGVALALGVAGVLSATAAGPWQKTEPLGKIRYDHAAVTLTDGRVLVVAGTGDRGSAELYDPAGNTWSEAPAPICEHSGHSATLLQDGRVLVTAGSGKCPDGEADGTLKRAEIFDPATGEWRYTGGLNVLHIDHTATLLSDGRVLVVAGNVPRPLSAELYDLSTDTWSMTEALAQPVQEQHAATLLRDGRVLVSGGRYDGQAISAAQVFDPATGVWTLTSPMAESRRGHSAVLLADGRVLVVGGRNAAGDYLKSAEIYDPASDTWTAAASLVGERFQATATVLGDGRVLIAGSEFVAEAIQKTAEIYDPATDSWSAVAALSIPRGNHTASLLGDGRVLVAGGFHKDAHQSAEIWTP